MSSGGHWPSSLVDYKGFDAGIKIKVWWVYYVANPKVHIKLPVCTRPVDGVDNNAPLMIHAMMMDKYWGLVRRPSTTTQPQRACRGTWLGMCPNSIPLLGHYICIVPWQFHTRHIPFLALATRHPASTACWPLKCHPVHCWKCDCFHMATLDEYRIKYPYDYGLRG